MTQHDATADAALATDRIDGETGSERPRRAFDATDMQITETLKLGDIKSREQCLQAIVDIDMQVQGMLAQIARVEADPSHSLNKPGWRTKVQNAIRWKKRARQAVQLLMTQFEKKRPASKDSLQQTMLDTFRSELGDDEFNRIRDIARDRHRVAFPDFEELP